MAQKNIKKSVRARKNSEEFWRPIDESFTLLGEQYYEKDNIAITAANQIKGAAHKRYAAS
jgi:hypothetical protein